MKQNIRIMNGKKIYMELFYRKLSKLISENIIEACNKHLGSRQDIFVNLDTMGRQEEYLRHFSSEKCKDACTNMKYYKVNRRMLKYNEIKFF